MFGLVSFTITSSNIVSAPYSPFYLLRLQYVTPFHCHTCDTSHTLVFIFIKKNLCASVWIFSICLSSISVIPYSAVNPISVLNFR